MLDLSSRKVYGALAEQCVGGDAKADKVETAVAGHLAGLDSNGNLTDSGVNPTEEVTVEGNPVTFDSPFEQDAKSVVVTVKPIQAGSGTPSPDNIRPISGIDEVEILRTGKNLCPIDNSSFTPNVQWVDLEGDAADTYRGTKLTLLAGTYFVKLYDTVNVLGLQVYNQATENLDITDLNGGSITLPLDSDIYIRVKAAVRSQTSFKTQIELGSTPTEYEPYTEHTTTIPLPSTLYDADVDVTNGDADNRYGYIASYNGETLPGAWISDRDVYTGSNSPTIGAEVAYELATPTTLSFTPADVELLEGTNVVSTNAEKVAVTYGRSLWQDISDLKTDTEGKLDKSDVATIEGDTASKAYSVNDFMLRADGLYKVTAPIASGASITASNTTKTTIGAVLTALLNA